MASGRAIGSFEEATPYVAKTPCVLSTPQYVGRRFSGANSANVLQELRQRSDIHRLREVTVKPGISGAGFVFRFSQT